ncbi:hypothetical protein C8Q77DRAFT_232181 [Trametes polyzona]|nr:hypothetical protein C8Q77DRAFT_232181 [Trametes polyzona]
MGDKSGSNSIAAQPGDFADSDRARLETESDTVVCSRTSLELKSHLNGLSPIGRLPSELLSEICVYSVIATLQHPPYPPLRWMGISHVCRLFRSICLGEPRFWSYLQPASSEAIDALILRSQSAPLHFLGRFIFPDLWHDTFLLEVLPQYAHRLREVCIEGPCEVLQTFYEQNLGRLEVIEKLVLKTNDRSSPYLRQAFADDVDELARHTVPPLRHLELLRVPIRWIDPVLSSTLLSTLIVSRKSLYSRPPDGAFPSPGSSDELLASLSTFASQLQELELDEVFPPEQFSSPDRPLLPQLTYPIPLPRLRTMRIFGDSLYVAHILSHLAFPSTTTLKLTVWNIEGVKQLMTTLSARCSEGDPLSEVDFHEDPLRPAMLTVSGWRRSKKMDKSAHFVITVHFIDEDGETPRLDFYSHFVQHAHPIFAAVETLRIRMTPFSRVTVAWSDILPQFPSARTLVVHHECDGFFQALTTPTSVPKREPEAQVLLPELRSLELIQYPCYPSNPKDDAGMFEELLDCAIFRCKHGCPLDRVAMRSLSYEVGPADVERLREVVLDVEWDKGSLRQAQLAPTPLVES